MTKNVLNKIKNYELFSGMIGAILGSIVGILSLYCQQKNFIKDYNTKISLEVILKFKNSMDEIIDLSNTFILSNRYELSDAKDYKKVASDIEFYFFMLKKSSIAENNELINCFKKYEYSNEKFKEIIKYKYEMEKSDQKTICEMDKKLDKDKQDFVDNNINMKKICNDFIKTITPEIRFN